jgi:hypothetical protein
MPKINAKMKRIIAEIERADSAHSLFYSQPRIIRKRPSEDTLRRTLEQAGVNLDKIKKTNKALGLRSKSNARALKSLRHFIADHRDDRYSVHDQRTSTVGWIQVCGIQQHGVFQSGLPRWDPA